MAPSVQPPRGMRDFLPEDKAHREAVLQTIRGVYAAYGYQEIETPVAEELDRLQASDGGENTKLMYRILRRGLPAGGSVPVAEAADLGLRFDLTLPLARFYATHRHELPAVFRSVQIAPVWRAERPQRGRYRQFTQCDIDIVGEAGHLAEVELIVATLSALAALGIADCTVRLNDRRLLHGMLAACGFEPGAFGPVLIIVDKIDKIGPEGVEAELQKAGFDREAVGRLADVLASDVAEAADPAVTASLAAIRAGVLEALPGASLRLDPTLVRGMGYYTGTIFEIHHPAAHGSVAGGGRYDDMIGRFLDQPVPACGFSIGFERVVDLVDRGRFTAQVRRVALLYGAGEAPGRLVALQRRLIADGCSVRLVERPKRLGRLLAALQKEGFTQYALVGPGGGAPELQPIGPSTRTTP